MASPGEKRRACDHLMAAFDSHTHSAKCHYKGKGSHPCVLILDCSNCTVLTTVQWAQLATPSYKIKTKSEIQSLTSLKEVSNNSVFGIITDIFFSF